MRCLFDLSPLLRQLLGRCGHGRRQDRVCEATCEAGRDAGSPCLLGAVKCGTLNVAMPCSSVDTLFSRTPQLVRPCLQFSPCMLACPPKLVGLGLPRLVRWRLP